MELTETEQAALDAVTTATVSGSDGYKPVFTSNKTEWNALMSLKDKGLIEERAAGPRGGKRFFAVIPPLKGVIGEPENLTPKDVIKKVEWTVTALDLCPEDQAVECKRNGHRDTGRGVCADCGEFLDPEPEPKPLPGLSLVLTADGGVKLS